MTLQRGLFIPNFGPFGDPAVLVELAGQAEDAGWDGLFLWDHILFENEGKPTVDPWIALTAIACSTSALRIGAMITPLARRRPWKVARETVSLDHVSNGRLIFGAGLGFPPEVEFGTFGEETDDTVRAKKLDEALAIMAGLWSGEQFEYTGEHFSVDETIFRPSPLQKPRIPIWCAGWWPNRRPFRRAAQWDGVVPEMVGGSTPTPEAVKEISTYVKRHRTSDDPFDIAVNGYSEGSQDSELMEEYRSSDVTWWLERIDPTRLFSVDEARGRIALGP
ncbi:MAG: LLM class flavin-dependent oxidoreductase [Solirubrobacterales bacterium]|nr:LLM class flavin-dependent oxidoreductase [Solirubrobacterales bacterium]